MWQFNKAIEQKLWDLLLSGGWDCVKAFLTAKGSYQYVNIGGGVEAFVSKLDGNTSDNNRVYNMSSIKFGD
jgi:hypothetical protein